VTYLHCRSGSQRRNCGGWWGESPARLSTRRESLHSLSRRAGEIVIDDAKPADVDGENTVKITIEF